MEKEILELLAYTEVILKSTKKDTELLEGPELVKENIRTKYKSLEDKIKNIIPEGEKLENYNDILKRLK